MSLLERAHSAEAWLTVSSSSVGTCFLASSSHFSPFITIGWTMWSEYLRMMDFSFQAESRSSWPSFRCRTISVPRSGRSTISMLNSPVPSDSQRTPWAASTPARRVSTVTLSATMKLE
jgi:hypothetical protein